MPSGEKLCHETENYWNAVGPMKSCYQICVTVWDGVLSVYGPF